MSPSTGASVGNMIQYNANHLGRMVSKYSHNSGRIVIATFSDSFVKYNTIVNIHATNNHDINELFKNN